MAASVDAVIPKGGDERRVAEVALVEEPDDLLCPVLHTIFRDPVVNAAGHTYERLALERIWAASGGRLIDPLTNLPLPHDMVFPNWDMRRRVLAFLDARPGYVPAGWPDRSVPPQGPVGKLPEREALPEQRWSTLFVVFSFFVVALLVGCLVTFGQCHDNQLVEKQVKHNTDEMTQKIMTKLRSHQEWQEEWEAKIMTKLKRHQEWQEEWEAIGEPVTSWKKVAKKESDPKQIPKLEVQSAQLALKKVLESSVGAEGRAQRLVQSPRPEEVPNDSREDAVDAKDKDSDKGEDDKVDEQPREEPGEKKRQFPPIYVGAVMPEDAVEEERREAINATQGEASSLADHTRALPPLPFQIMNQKVLEQSIHGVFWVCFPPSALEQDVKKYAPVFNEVARSQKWRIYPFCYLDTRRPDFKYLKIEDQRHFCDDLNEITFVMERKSSKVVPGSNPASSPLDGIPTDFLVESPGWFRRMFRADQTIRASLVEEFLNDVHSGKIPEVIVRKGDL